MGKIWFTSDLHFKHEKILTFHEGRRIFGNTIEQHDNALIEHWNTTIDKKDTVYILGDLALCDGESFRKLLQRLNGNKVLISGNHDKMQDYNKCYFNHIVQIKNMVFKKTVYPFLNEDFKVVMCHFPMLSWEHKDKGVYMLHGHCHGKIDSFNIDCEELRVDVGIDASLANYNFISLEKLYKHAMKVTKGKTCSEYAKEIYTTNRDIKI